MAPALCSFFPPRLWKLAAPKAKAKPKAAPKPKAKAKALPGAPGAPEPSLDMQKAYKARAAAPGGRAASSWPLTGGRYPLPLFGDAEPECVLGWAMISWATQGSAVWCCVHCGYCVHPDVTDQGRNLVRPCSSLKSHIDSGQTWIFNQTLSHTKNDIWCYLNAFPWVLGLFPAMMTATPLLPGPRFWPRDGEPQHSFQPRAQAAAPWPPARTTACSWVFRRPGGCSELKKMGRGWKWQSHESQEELKGT